MKVDELEEHRKLIAHHCQQIMVEVFKVIDQIESRGGIQENKYQYLERYKAELRAKLKTYMNENWWGRKQ